MNAAENALRSPATPSTAHRPAVAPILMDTFRVDGDRGIIGRPTVAVAVCARTRTIVGFGLSIDTPT